MRKDYSVERRFLKSVTQSLGTSRSRRQVLGTAARGALGGAGAAMLGRGLSGGLLDGGLALAAGAQGATVTIKEFEFVPRTLEIPVGTEVVWTNTGGLTHNATAFDGSFASPNLTNGQTFAHTFTEAGDFGYICTIHGEPMSGTISVVEAGSPTPTKVYVRPNLHKLEPDALADYLRTYAAGIAAMKSRDTATGDPKVWRTSWMYQANIHGVPPTVHDELDEDELAKRAWASCQHHQWFFFPWHRMYLYWFERILRKAIPDQTKAANFALPYWDYFVPAQRVLPDQFFMPDDTASNPLYLEGRGPYVSGGATWPTFLEYIFDHRPALTYLNFSHAPRGISFGGQVSPVDHQGPDGGQLENVTHDWVHGYVGGLMGDPATAGNDPIFWLHHANIDRLWKRWLDQTGAFNPSQTIPQDAPWYAAEFLFFNEDGDEVRMTGKMILDTVCQLDYRYEDDDPDTDCAPPEAAGTPVVSATGPAPQPTVLAEIESETALGPDLVTVPIELEPEAANVLTSTAASPEAVGAAPRVVLTILGVRGTDVPGVSNQVYLNLPEGQEPDPSGPYFVGTISLFGRQPHNLDEHSTPVQSFDITENVQALQEQGEQPQQLVLTFVPFRYGGAVAGEATPAAEAAQGPWITIDGYSIAVQ